MAHKYQRAALGAAAAAVWLSLSPAIPRAESVRLPAPPDEPRPEATSGRLWPDQSEGLRAGDQAILFETIDENEQPVDMADMIEGRPLVLVTGSVT